MSEKWSDILALDASELCPDVTELIDLDRALEASSINLIASASYAPKALRQIQATHLVFRII